VPDGGTRVLVEGANPMTIMGTVSILGLTVGGGSVAPTVTMNGTVTVGENVVLLGKSTLVWNQPSAASNDLIVAAGGLLTHSPNTSTEPIN